MTDDWGGCDAMFLDCEHVENGADVEETVESLAGDGGELVVNRWCKKCANDLYDDDDDDDDEETT